MMDELNIRAMQPDAVQPSTETRPARKARPAAGKSFGEVLGEVNKLESKVDRHLQGLSTGDEDVRRAALEVDQAFKLTMKMSTKLSEAYKAYQQNKTD